MIVAEAISQCENALNAISSIADYNQLMGMEGTTAKVFFSAYFQDLNWKGRHPRMKCDALNVSLDIGYTILFNFIESFVRMFGFDLYIGVYYLLWFKIIDLRLDGAFQMYH